MSYNDTLFLIDNDGNEHELTRNQVNEDGEILIKNSEIKIEDGFKIIKKHKGVCCRIYMIKKLTRTLCNSLLIKVKEL